MKYRNRCALQLVLAGALPMCAQTAPNWSQAMLNTSPPPPRAQHAMAFDSIHSQVVLFGGFLQTGTVGALPPTEYNDTWVWNGSKWTNVSPSGQGPIGRDWHAMVFDSARQQLVLFGGETSPSVSAGSVLSDTWTWDGMNWTLKSPPTSPTARKGHAMVYDAAHSQVVLFGGQIFQRQGLNTSFVSQNDTWVWDGTNWTQKTPTNSPPARAGHAMAYDSAHGQVVMFGGTTDAGSDLKDTWIWDGTNWTQKSPQNSPSVRWGHAIAYDSGHNDVVMFGGTSNGFVQNDTWLWDGGNWTQLSIQTSPTARTTHAMVDDSTTGLLIVFGGDSNSATYFAGKSTQLSDTWTWLGAALPAAAPAISSVISASAFGGFSAVAPGSWVEIYGSNLAPDTRQWMGSDFNGNNAPTSLEGVQVSIGGQNAFIDYISLSPGQVNAQLPSNIPTGGPLAVTLSNAKGTSQPFKIPVNAVEPGLLAPSSFQIGGKQYVVALLPDGTYVLPAGTISGVSSRPAQPGETITLYGIGFGSVMPDIPAGQIVVQANQLTQSLAISVDQTLAQIAYAGLAPGFVGLYQFNIVVPSVPDSDLVPLTFNLGGVAGTQVLYTSIHK